MADDQRGDADTPAGGPDFDDDIFSSSDASDDVAVGAAKGKLWVPVVALVAVLLLVGVFVLNRGDEGGGSTGSANDSDTTEAPKERSWPDELDFKPTVLGGRDEGIEQVPADAPSGIYIWSDFSGWHLWIVDPVGKAGAKGNLFSDADFGDASLAENSLGTVALEGANVPYDFSTAGRVAGFHFGPGFYATSITVNPSGPDLPIFLGVESTPAQSPYTMTKTVR